MEFLTILIVLGLLQLWGSGGPVQQDNWFDQLIDFVQGIVSGAELRLLLIVGLPVCAVLLAQILFESLLFGLLLLLLYVVVFLFSLGRGDYSESIRRYISAWENSNYQSAYEQATAIGGFEPDNVNDHVSLHERVRKAIIYQGFERWFAVVFWFLLLGPAGAILYRLSFLAGRSESLASTDRQLALRCVYYLDWIPARLIMVSFALTGNFVNGFNRFWQMVWQGSPTDELLEVSALAAISAIDDKEDYPAGEEQFIAFGSEQLSALQALLSRSVICWLVIIALGTLL